MILFKSTFQSVFHVVPPHDYFEDQDIEIYELLPWNLEDVGYGQIGRYEIVQGTLEDMFEYDPF